ncbi:DNA phosphorothioation-dependent restriction protein DptF [Terribacillus saccharophilus]|uniref:DNA phosphorothioation-dependent restriction protein DptF n=1 Tax=Terribacillus saccharophilus TaxID=361277 RepID=UPI000C9B4D36|nr:DNA phosphorothioation-dependent restriction protein DptF [Terribacillus goriensis]
MSNDNFCSFLESGNEPLYKLANKVHELVYVDANSSIIQGRKFAELLLKEVYKEERGTENEPTLYEMIRILYSDGLFKKPIQEKLDFLRLHGNKAAHDTAENSQITALQVHKSLFDIAAWYTELYQSPDIEIPDYKEPKPTTRSSLNEEEVEEIIKKHINTLSSRKGVEQDRALIAEEDNGEYILEEELSKEQSYLLRELTRLRASSQEALENVGKFNKFKNYMHVTRSIQLNLETELKAAKQEDKKLILLAGSVGDGKSHLLSYIQENKPELLEGITIINDATESDSPERNSLETLRDKLKGFSDQFFDQNTEKVILAINLGVLNNFISYNHEDLTFSRFNQFISNSNIFANDVNELHHDDLFTLINFAGYQPFELREDGISSKYFGKIMERITSPTINNPFYCAYLKDLKNNMFTAMHMNYEVLTENKVRKTINQLICKLIIEKKLVISTRTFLNFIADILIPRDVDLAQIKVQNMTEFELLENSLTSLLFQRHGKSEILDELKQYDPTNKRTKRMDEIINSLYNTRDFGKLLELYVDDEVIRKVFNPLMDLLSKDNKLEKETFQTVTRNIIQAAYFTDDQLKNELEDKILQQYIYFLYGYNRQSKAILRDIYDKVKKVIFAWKGSPRKDYIYINNMTEKYRVAQKIIYEPLPIVRKRKRTDEELESFDTTILLSFTEDRHASNLEPDLTLEIDLPLFKLLYKIGEGYRPNKKDQEDGLSFKSFIDKLVAMSSNKTDLLIHYHGEKEIYTLRRDFGDSFAFEKVD